MAFDGITIACITAECNRLLAGGRIYKIAQPETNELLLTIKTESGQYRLLLSADPSLPLAYLTEENKPAPQTAPTFCMLLRKHLQNARILSVTQPGLERVIEITAEHLDEMGDLCRRKLILELMGKHSNLILCDEDNVILDSIKHISGLTSSVRQVLPGQPYFIPKTQEKSDPLEWLDMPDSERESTFQAALFTKPLPLYKALYQSFTGLSPVMAQEICHRAKADPDRPAKSYNTHADSDSDACAATSSPNQLHNVYLALTAIMEQVRNSSFSPAIYYQGKTPVEYAALPLTLYDDLEKRPYESISALLADFYAQKDKLLRMKQKTADLRHIVQTAIERNVKKYDLQMQQLKDTEKREKYRLYGELLNAYGYSVPEGAKVFEAEDYHTGKTVQIPLDNQLSPQENAKKYFEKYGKMKRTYEALTSLTESVKNEIDHLESIAASLELATQEEDLVQIKDELAASGYIRYKRQAKNEKFTSKPFHYITSDGFHVYVGKNNYQNDDLTFHVANGGDWWFHAKGCPGSHVILKTEGKDVPDRAFEEAAALAAYYSKGRDQEKVEIDYLQRKNVKKPNGAAPGFVVYYTNYSMMIAPEIEGLTQV